MAAGVDLSKYADYVVESMVDVQLKQDLAEYYKVAAQCLSSAGNAKEGFELLTKFADILIPEREAMTDHRNQQLMNELNGLDQWKLHLDLSHLSRSDIMGNRAAI
jgi:hypothetical protein